MQNTQGSNTLRVGVILPSIGQIVYGLGLGNSVVAITNVSEQTLLGFGINVSSNAVDLGLGTHLPDYLDRLIKVSANYVPVDSGIFAGDIAGGDLSNYQAANISITQIVGSDNNNMQGVEKDIMTVANATGRTQQGSLLVSNMQGILNGVQANVSSTSRSSVAMVVYYGYGSLYVAGNQSFIGSEISTANGNSVFPGDYPSPEVAQLLFDNPDYIIASIFSWPADITTTYQQLKSIPGIDTTTAWQTGNVYILGNLATNLTAEPGPLAAYGVLLYAIILHPQQFGYNNSTLPHNITDSWVKSNILSNIKLWNIVQTASQPSTSQLNWFGTGITLGTRVTTTSTTTSTSSTSVNSTTTVTTTSTTTSASTTVLTTTVPTTVPTTIPAAEVKPQSATSNTITPLMNIGIAVAVAIAIGVAYSRMRGPKTNEGGSQSQ